MEKSPLKWMGGKKKLLPEIRKHIPENYNTYIEPFFGSGAVFFDLEPKHSICSDIQPQPILICNAIKNNPSKFIKEFMDYSDTLWDTGEDFYYHVRDMFNKHRNSFPDVKHAAMFYLLLKGGFNGLVRFNSKGEWNVPFGDRGHKNSKKQAQRLILDEQQIQKYSLFLNSGNKEFLVQDFEKTIARANKGDLIYCDPPYIETTQKYNSWSYDHEERLYKALASADNRGANFVLSNVYEYKGKVNERLLDLYKDFFYSIIQYNYVIGPSKKRRQSVKEILIFNKLP